MSTLNTIKVTSKNDLLEKWPKETENNHLALIIEIRDTHCKKRKRKRKERYSSKTRQVENVRLSS